MMVAGLAAPSMLHEPEMESCLYLSVCSESVRELV